MREIAEREHLINAKRKDSQGICFLGNIDYNEYVRRYLGEQVGDVVELETGKIIGQHKGLWFHTIGQRKGLGFGGGPWFVVKKDVTTNVLFVSHGYDPETAYKKDFRVHGLHWLTEIPCSEVGNNNVEATEQISICFKIRHTPEFHKGYLELLSTNNEGEPTEAIVHSEDKIHGVAPGQFCVIYDKDHNRCFGSAEITF